MVLDEAVIAIDFQDARMGPALYDPASLVFDSYVDLDLPSRIGGTPPRVSRSAS